MILFQLAQTLPINQAAIDVYLQWGAGVFLLLVTVGLVGKIWLNSEDAKVKRDKEDTRRDASILDNSIQLTKTLSDVATLGIALAEERGKVTLLTVQLENLRDKNQREREELKTSIRSLALKVESYEAEIAELKAAVNGKAKEIAALTLERDNLNQQLKDRDETVLHLEKQVSTLEEEIRGLKLKADESALQIASLGEQLSKLDPVHSGDTGKVVPINIVTTTKTEITEANKEFTNIEESEQK